MATYVQLLAFISPFLAFMVGYVGSLGYLHTSVVQVPALVGKNLHEAAVLLSQKNLGLKILSLKDDSFLPEGTVISQIPTADQSIKISRSVLVVVAKKPTPSLMIDLQDKTINEIADLAKDLQASVKIVKLENKHLAGKCFTQIPSVGNEIIDHKIVAYVADKMQAMYIMPSFRGMVLSAVQEYLEKERIRYEVFDFSGQDKQAEALVVIDQKPIFGTIISLDKLNVQLNVGFKGQNLS